jgi:hypothetical protein
MVRVWKHGGKIGAGGHPSRRSAFASLLRMRANSGGKLSRITVGGLVLQ